MKKLIFLLLLIISVGANAQLYQQMPQAGYGPVKRMWIDSILVAPTNVTSGDNLSGGREVGKVRYNITDSSWQVYTGYQWLAGNRSSGANTALSNLASVAINTSLLPGTDNSIDLGSSSKQWRSIYLPNTDNSSTDGVMFKGGNRFLHTFKLTGTDGDNLFIGNLSGNFSMTGSSGLQGSYNTGVGPATLFNNTTGFRNTATGTYSLQNNTTGFNNTAFGSPGLFANTTGYGNNAFGVRALNFNTTGYQNSAFGVDALFGNTTGYYNVGLGLDAIYNGTTSYKNVAVGCSTLFNHNTGYSNIAIGYKSMFNNTTGHHNTVIGDSTGLSLKTATNNTIVGANVTGLDSGLNKNIILADGEGVQRLRFNENGALSFDGGSSYGTAGYVLTSGGANTIPTWSASGANLTATYIGYGSGSNTLTGDANLTYTAASSAVALDSGYLSFTGNKDFGSSVTGSIFKNSNYGLTFRGVPGASYDMLFFTQGGSTLFANPTGTTQMGTVSDWGFGLLGSTISAKVHIAAGSTAAGSAPLKINSGSLMTTAEAGAFEYTTPQLFFTNGGLVRQELFQGQQSRVSTQYDNATTTLGNVTGLTANVAAGKVYRFEAKLYTTSDVAGGIKVAIGGTATATAIRYEGLTTDAGLTTQGRSVALGTAVGNVTAVTAAYVTITGTITVNAAGTLTVQAAANAATGTTSVLTGSTFVITEML